MSYLKHKEEYSLLLLLSFVVFIPVSGFSQNLDTLLSVGKQNLHFNIHKGEGIPILFESGGGNDGSIWNPLLEPLQEITGTTLITYDRAAYGQSTPNPDLPEKEKGYIEPGIESLFSGLDKIGYDEELILVAHSYGGFYALKFAAMYPERIKAIVLIDVNLKSFWTDQFLEQKRVEFTPEWLD
ncbi:MAG: alpha/beta fold hydrolase, partial [Bacteroidota bacterium]